jgi:hypothetical protein
MVREENYDILKLMCVYISEEVFSRGLNKKQALI